MDIFADFGKIKGSVTAKGYQNHVELSSLGFMSGSAVWMEIGKGATRDGHNKPFFSEVSFNKKMDKSSVAFFVGSMAGKAIDKVEIKYVKTSKDATETYLTYTLHTVLVSDYAVVIDKDGDPQENISLAYDMIEMKYHPRKADNTNDSAMPAGYDLVTATTL